MKTIKYLRCLYLSLFTGFIITSGCTVKIPIKVPSGVVDRLIPYYVVLVIPEDIKEIKCMHPETFNFERFNCGAAFYDVYTKAMENTFIYTYRVTNIKQATKQWGRALYLKIDKIEIIQPYFEKMSAAISFKYKMTDWEEKELLSSAISVVVTEDEVKRDTHMLSELFYKATHKMIEEISQAYKNEQL